MTKQIDQEKALLAAFEEFEIIDCHEHLGPEKRRLNTPIDVFTLFSHYTHGDLSVAGMSEDNYQSLFDPNIPLDKRWDIFKPFWENIRWGSYARAALLAAEKFYGHNDISDDTFDRISAKMQEFNKPGIYEKVLNEVCGIRLAITQCGSTELDSSFLVPVMPLAYPMETWQVLAHPEFDESANIRSLDDYIDTMRQYVLKVKTEGAVGLKMMSNPYQTPSRTEAVFAFNQLQTGAEHELPQPNPLRDYVVDEIIKFASEQDLVICVHTGYWGDFRTLDPLHMIPVLQRHPRARFDVYHLGYPWVREALMLGKGFANVWLNLCWTHIISQRFVASALDEAMDLIPMNKLLAFGGDYGLPVEKVFGHLVMAREDIASVLSRRIKAGQLTEAQAIHLARKWFWDNPVELYRLNV